MKSWRDNSAGTSEILQPPVNINACKLTHTHLHKVRRMQRVTEGLSYGEN